MTSGNRNQEKEGMVTPSRAPMLPPRTGPDRHGPVQDVTYGHPLWAGLTASGAEAVTHLAGGAWCHNCVLLPSAGPMEATVTHWVLSGTPKSSKLRRVVLSYTCLKRLAYVPNLGEKVNTEIAFTVGRTLLVCPASQERILAKGRAVPAHPSWLGRRKPQACVWGYLCWTQVHLGLLLGLRVGGAPKAQPTVLLLGAHHSTPAVGRSNGWQPPSRTQQTLREKRDHRSWSESCGPRAQLCNHLRDEWQFNSH